MLYKVMFRLRYKLAKFIRLVLRLGQRLDKFNRSVLKD